MMLELHQLKRSGARANRIVYKVLMPLSYEYVLCSSVLPSTDTIAAILGPRDEASRLVRTRLKR